MRFPLLKHGLSAFYPQRNRVNTEHGLCAPARADRRTKNLTKRLRPGEIAIIDHADLDGPAAEALVACRAAAVINASLSISGRYPNRGPEVLLAAGIPLIDAAGVELLEQVIDGDILCIRGSEIYQKNECIASGREMTPARLQAEITAARKHLDI